MNGRILLAAVFLILAAAVRADEENIGGISGRVCAFGDMNNDRYTDMIVQVDTNLRINIQNENGQFSESTKLHPISVGVAPVSCTVGDFNGDSIPDILVSKQSSHTDGAYETTMHIFTYNAFMPFNTNLTFYDQPSVMDVNGDGISDVVGFIVNTTNNNEVEFRCILGMKSLSEFTKETDCTGFFVDMHGKPVHGFPHFFADINGDLSSEIVFGMEDDEHNIRLEAWKSVGERMWRYQKTLIKDIPSNSNFKYFGGAIVGDIDGNGSTDIVLPVCRERECAHVDNMLFWTQSRGWGQFTIDLKESAIVSDSNSKVLFRIGDFNLDGYPDLIAAMLMPNNKVYPMIIENVPVSEPTNNITRKFELRSSRLVEPGEVALGDITMVSFFDLKEDGSLDILVEYKYDTTHLKHDFIRCEDKGDTTFLKVQTFTSVCSTDCPGGYDKKDIGSGIAWHGACATFKMADSWGEKRESTQCQMPQTSHRSLATPYTLFGLGRSPNFVDLIRIGTPRFPGLGPHLFRTDLKQIVPNSRLVVIPPTGRGTGWLTRLYVTPSKLIIQSLFVLVSMCVLLILLVGYLHFRERKEDRKERQMQSHRFHFDAL